MSIKLITELYESRSIDAKLQRVLLCLCDNANDDGVCWPSIGRIAWKLECSEDTVQRAIKNLKALGVVTVIPREGHSNVYRVDLSVLPEKDPYQPSGQTPPQNATPPQNDPHRGMQNAGDTPPQNATQNRQENLQPEPSIVVATKTKRASRIEEPFGIDDATMNWAFSEGFTFQDVAREKDKFVDYHAAKGSTFVDWQRAFKNWLRNSRQFGQRGRATQHPAYYRPNGGLTAEGMAAKARGEIQ